MVNFEREGILKFVTPNFSAETSALVIESPEILAGLRELLPFGKIALLISESMPKIEMLCKNLKIDLLLGDYSRGGLPKQKKIFDVIIAEDCMTTAPEFYATLLELNQLLKDSGYLVTKILNARFVGILEGLKIGKFSATSEKFWAKADAVKFLGDSMFKEIRFLPGEKLENESAAKVWEEFGFDNFNDDLITKTWLVKACRCEAEVAALKELFTEEIRAELSRLIHRIEYDIDVEENILRLKKLCERENIFEDYLNDFISQVTTHKIKI